MTTTQEYQGVLANRLTEVRMQKKALKKHADILANNTRVYLQWPTDANRRKMHEALDKYEAYQQG